MSSQGVDVTIKNLEVDLSEPKQRNYLCICIICFCFPYLQRRDNLTIELSMKDREYHFCDNNDVNNYDNNDVSNDVNNDDNNTDDQKPPQQCQ